MEPVITGGCVLYPNMCFRGSVYEVVEDEAKENLKEVLTPDEYESIFDSGKYRNKTKNTLIFSDKTVSIFMLKNILKENM